MSFVIGQSNFFGFPFYENPLKTTPNKSYLLVLYVRLLITLHTVCIQMDTNLRSFYGFASETADDIT